ncbi:MAG: hypothetical protein ACK5PF_06825 [bacterium]|jgi:hypothetical protein
MQSAFDELFQSQPAGGQHPLQPQASFDPVETYFTCITTCSLDDGECVTRCVEELREQP